MYPPLKAIPETGLIKDKLNNLKETFQSLYGCDPEFYVRAPGRVNIIGEHIDYCGYAVFPIAIQQDIVIACSRRNDSQLCVYNTDAKYESFECNMNTLRIDDIKPKWYKYLLCGIEGIRDIIEMGTLIPGLSFALMGDIPQAVGLSSSSALVCAAALAVSHCLSMKITLKHLAELCARAERYIGTQGGGMDQAASFLSNAGSAQLIEFEPLRCTPVSLPKGATFVVINSLAEKNKAASSEFNTRVIECRLACRILAKKCNVTFNGKIILGALQEQLGRSFSEMVEVVKEFIHPQPYSKQEICQILQMTSERLDEDVLSPNTRHITEYHLYKRALHVFTEASRVLEFKEVCDKWSEKLAEGCDQDSTIVLQQLGKLMDESHASANYLYECSHPKLDELVQLSKGVVYGARLTGAGWGGCIVSLVPKDRTNSYIEKIKGEYFMKAGIDITEWDNVIFSTEPGDGASVFVP